MIVKILVLVVLLAAIAWVIYAAISLIMQLRQPLSPQTDYFTRRSAVWFVASGLLTILAALGYRWAAERQKRLKLAWRA